MNIETRTKILKLKGLLNDISHASFSYRELSKDFPLEYIKQSEALQLINAYKDIVETVKNSIMNYEKKNDRS